MGLSIGDSTKIHFGDEQIQSNGAIENNDIAREGATYPAGEQKQNKTNTERAENQKTQNNSFDLDQNGATTISEELRQDFCLLLWLDERSGPMARSGFVVFAFLLELSLILSSSFLHLMTFSYCSLCIVLPLSFLPKLNFPFRLFLLFLPPYFALSDRSFSLLTAWKQLRSTFGAHLNVLPNANLAGKDTNGNLYYEAKTSMFSRVSSIHSLPQSFVCSAETEGTHRWVVFAGKDFDGSDVPPEWHSWLHHNDSKTPVQVCPRPFLFLFITTHTLAFRFVLFRSPI